MKKGEYIFCFDIKKSLRLETYFTQLRKPKHDPI